MRRTGFTGDIWPDEIQELLLRAALLPADRAAAAWAAVRPRIDVDFLPGELHRLMPLLSKALAARGSDDPELPRLKGVYQFSWYRNQRLFVDGSSLLDALDTAGVSTMILRGAAVAAGCYRDAGLRSMNDLDFLVRPADVPPAAQVAEAEGWWRVPGTEPGERREGALTLRNDHGRIVRLHWQPSRNMSVPEATSEPMWQRAPSVMLLQRPTRILGAADHLVQACVDGARANSGSSLRWITDTMALLGRADLDWDVVVSEARRHHASLLVGEAMRYLVQALDADVPDDIVDTLAATPATPRERVAHRLSLTTGRRVASGAELLGRFIRLTADLPAPRVIAAAPEYLQSIFGVDRRRDVPVAAARKAVRAVVSPSPPLASLSTAGRPADGRQPTTR